MPWGAIASIAGPIIGGLLSSDAIGSASDAQTNAANQSNATQLAMYNQNRADMQPWREAGVNALGQLSEGTKPGGNLLRPFGMSDFQADPGYGFRLDQGMKAIQQSQAARGGLLSGGALKGIERFGQDLGTQEYGNAYNRFNQDQSNQFNRLASISGLGQSTAQQVGAMGTNVANSIGQTQQGLGNALGAGAIASSNALTGGIAGAGNMYMGQQYLNALRNRESGYARFDVPGLYQQGQPEYGYGG